MIGEEEEKQGTKYKRDPAPGKEEELPIGDGNVRVANSVGYKADVYLHTLC